MSIYHVFIGTITRGDSSARGIYRSTFNAASGSLSDPVLAAELDDASFVELHPGGKYLYSVGRPGGEGTVCAYAVDSAAGGLTPLNQQPSGGSGPCHVTLDPKGRCVLVSNYSGGSASGYPVLPDGSLGPITGFVQHEGSSINKSRQEAAHVHSVTVSPDGNYALAADLGTDQVAVYRLGPDGGLAANEPAGVFLTPGSGPRHMAFHPNRSILYLINELNSSITVLAYEATTGGLSELQTVSTLPVGFEGENKGAEIRVHPSGRFLYGSNRGHNSIAVFHIDPETHRLTPAGHQTRDITTPRNFNLDPSGRWCLVGNKHGASIVAFRINQDTGALDPTDTKVTLDWPTCIRFGSVR